MFVYGVSALADVEKTFAGKQFLTRENSLDFRFDQLK